LDLGPTCDRLQQLRVDVLVARPVRNYRDRSQQRHQYRIVLYSMDFAKQLDLGPIFHLCAFRLSSDRERKDGRLISPNSVLTGDSSAGERCRKVSAVSRNRPTLYFDRAFAGLRIAEQTGGRSLRQIQIQHRRREFPGLSRACKGARYVVWHLRGRNEWRGPMGRAQTETRAIFAVRPYSRMHTKVV
jgi:hypothetical protein